MKLTEEQQRLVVEFIERTWPFGQACPTCGCNEWAIRNRTFEIPEHFGGSKGAQRAALPVVAMTCEKCGNVVFLDAVKVGIANPEQTRGGNGTGSRQNQQSSS